MLSFEFDDCMCFSRYPVVRKMEGLLMEEHQEIELEIDSETSCAVSDNVQTVTILVTISLSGCSSTDDDKRVILEAIPGYMNCHHDYINASYVDVSKSRSIIYRYHYYDMCTSITIGLPSTQTIHRSTR